MNIVKRDYTENDYPSVMELWKLAGIKTSLSDTIDELHKLVFKPDNKFVLLLIGESIIGTVICGHDGRRGYIHHVAVHPDYQKQGYGKLLMEEAQKHYASLGTVKVHIFIEQTNSSVIEFYQSLGWEIRDDIILMTQTLRR